MSYTACEYRGEFVDVDGVSYACVIGGVLLELSQSTTDDSRRSESLNRLSKLRDQVRRWPTNMIGGDLGEMMVDGEQGKEEFLHGLDSFESKLRSLGETIPSDYLREIVAPASTTDYIQDGGYSLSPFLDTIDKIRELVSGGYDRG
jgi:hypothetical protein